MTEETKDDDINTTQKNKPSGYLVHKFKKLEGMKIGDDIVVLISDVEAGYVTLATKAPAAIHIERLTR